MERTEIRLDCLKLAHRHDRGPADVLALAKVYEEYVAGKEQEAGEAEAQAETPAPQAEMPQAPVKRGPGRPPKNAGNP